MGTDCVAAVQRSPEQWAELSVNGAVVGGRSRVGAVPYAVEAQRATEAQRPSDGGVLAARLDELSGAVPEWYVNTPSAAPTAGYGNVDMGISRTMTFARRRRVHAVIHGAMGFSGASGGECQVRVRLSGVPGDSIRAVISTAGFNTPWTFIYEWPDVPAGTWTFSVWYTATVSGQSCASRENQMLLMVH